MMMFCVAAKHGFEKKDGFNIVARYYFGNEGYVFMLIRSTRLEPSWGWCVVESSGLRRQVGFLSGCKALF